MYKLTGIHENPEVLNDLTGLAKDKGVRISFDNPNNRKKIGFFAGVEAKHTDTFAYDEKEEQQTGNKPK
jgi:hypothetical protein